MANTGWWIISWAFVIVLSDLNNDKISRICIVTKYTSFYLSTVMPFEKKKKKMVSGVLFDYQL